ncbi:MAG: PilZ domain-containing protein [Hyphomicrobiales bacterium]|nr:PilZ domain-containing protein [Hyphomicrobiales bacterium]MBV9434022.1 PilZ domain-containing protein [Hyphomicrobiales bacterium]
MRSERRKNYRVQWHAWTMISACDGDWSCPCVLSDFSNGGAKLSGLNVRHIPDEFILRMARGVRPRHCRVLWRSADAVGVEFTKAGAGAEDELWRARTPRTWPGSAPGHKLELVDEDNP